MKHQPEASARESTPPEAPASLTPRVTLAPNATRKVPRSALRFAAAAVAVTMSDTSLMNFSQDNPADLDAPDDATVGSPPPPYPISIRARTTGIAQQGYWGACVHDMSGFIPPDGPIPLDWNHSEEEDIGVADTITIDDEGLLAAARLIPFTQSDRAAELIYKGKQKVPYQASIVMNLENLIVTEVPDGVSYTVNGQDFTGPLVVFSQWSIDGISILPFGSDSQSSVEFSRGQGEVEVVVRPVALSLRDRKAVEAKPPAPSEKEPHMTAPAIQLPPEAATFSREEALKFKTDFGAEGFSWYLEGKSYPEAAKIFGAQLQSQIESLKADLVKKDEVIVAITKERDDLKAKSEFRRGHPTPARVDPPAGGTPPEEKPDPSHFGRSKGMQSFVHAIERKLAPAPAQ